MIFVTVGEQLPFDRLIRTVDECALTLGQQIYAQIGDTELVPNNIEYQKFLDPQDFERKFNDADLVVAHAGMGTIITALELNKPLIVMPRKAILKEHRNDHQFATVKRFFKLKYLSVAFDDSELKQCLLEYNIERLGITKQSSIEPAPLLIKTIKDFIS